MRGNHDFEQGMRMSGVVRMRKSRRSEEEGVLIGMTLLTRI
jgi:hypothetical protein